MIYSKTDAGLNAIKDRQAVLTPRQRSVLIMCDGKRDSADILKNTSGLGVTAEDIEALVVKQMLISADSATNKVMPMSAQATAIDIAPVAQQTTAPQQRPPVSSEELKVLIRKATKNLENLLGPSCESMSLKLEKSKSYDEFAIKIYDIRRVLITIRSEKVADDFVAAILA